MTEKEFNEIANIVYKGFQSWASTQAMTVMDFCESVAEMLENENYRKITVYKKELKQKDIK